jgi:large subunit ribosomal protein L13
MVRGMVPKRKPGGLAAFKRLRVYMRTPDQIKGSKIQSFPDSKITKPESYYISIGEVAKQLGWKGE